MSVQWVWLRLVALLPVSTVAVCRRVWAAVVPLPLLLLPVVLPVGLTLPFSSSFSSSLVDESARFPGLSDKRHVAKNNTRHAPAFFLKEHWHFLLHKRKECPRDAREQTVPCRVAIVTPLDAETSQQP